MLKISTIETQIFVTYTINAIPAVFKKSLDQHLVDNVWGQRMECEEYIYTETNDNQQIIAVRYQFGESFSDYMAEEVGDLIEQQINYWIARNNIGEFA
jgi:hypothetical protein